MEAKMAFNKFRCIDYAGAENICNAAEFHHSPR
jgi:hypothetical protein